MTLPQRVSFYLKVYFLCVLTVLAEAARSPGADIIVLELLFEEFLKDVGHLTREHSERMFQ